MYASSESQRHPPIKRGLVALITVSITIAALGRSMTASAQGTELASGAIDGNSGGSFATVDVGTLSGGSVLRLTQTDAPCLSGPRPGAPSGPFGFTVFADGALLGTSSNVGACVHTYGGNTASAGTVTVQIFNYAHGRRATYRLTLDADAGAPAPSVAADLALATFVPDCDWKDEPPTFEDFKACTYREPDGGPWIVDGDIPIYDEDALRSLFEVVVASDDVGELKMRDVGQLKDGLIVHQVNSQDSRWYAPEQCDITYCVSTSFGPRYNAAVLAMEQAAADWSAVAGVTFRHVVAQDALCTAGNSDVQFDVRPIANAPYLARAFFPHQPRPQRNVMIDDQTFGPISPWTIRGILRHELGHTLGFRHEHTRPEAAMCFEDNSWRPLTDYDSLSVMHYPQCNGAQTSDLSISPKDASGAGTFYGAPGGCGESVTCRLFEDGYRRITGPTTGITTLRLPFLRDVTFDVEGRTRRWFGRCATTRTGEAVEMRVFEDGLANPSPYTDAVYIRRGSQACSPDGTSAGACRKWFGEFRTTGGRPVACFLFDDAGANRVGPTRAIYYNSSGKLCMPDGTGTGTCRKYWGQCAVQ